MILAIILGYFIKNFTKKWIYLPGQQPNSEAAQPHPSWPGPIAEVSRSAQHPNSESLQLQPSYKIFYTKFIIMSLI